MYVPRQPYKFGGIRHIPPLVILNVEVSMVLRISVIVVAQTGKYIIAFPDYDLHFTIGAVDCTASAILMEIRGEFLKY